MRRQGRLQPILPTRLGRHLSGQGGKLQVDVAVHQPGQDGAVTVVADQTGKAGQNFRRRTHRGNPVACHHHRPIPDGRPAHRQDPFTYMRNH